MNLIAGEIKDLLKAHDYGYPVSVVRTFRESAKVFPRIVVSQVNDSTGIRTANKEHVSMDAAKTEIYTQDAVDKNGKVTSRVDVSDQITEQVDDLMYARYKMNRDSVTEDTRYAIDTVRRIIRYSCAIDEFGYTYRTI